MKEAGLDTDVVATIAKSGVDARIASFCAKALAEACDCDPDASLGYLFGEKVSVKAGLDAALELDCD